MPDTRLRRAAWLRRLGTAGCLALAAGLLVWAYWASEREYRIVNHLRRWELSEPISMLVEVKAIRLRVHRPEGWPAAKSPELFAHLERYAVDKLRARIVEMGAATEMQVLTSRNAVATTPACEILDVEIAFHPYRRDRATIGDNAGTFFVTKSRPPLLGIRQGKSICAGDGVPSDVMPNGPYVPYVDRLEPGAVTAVGEEVIRRLVDYVLIDFIYLGSDRARTWVGQRKAYCSAWLRQG